MTECCIAAVDRKGIPENPACTAVVPWWSFTKVLIAAAALRLVEQGRLFLDAPLPGHPFTLRQLLQHRAGLGDYGRLPQYQADVAGGKAPWSEQELHAHVPLTRFVFAPGTGWAYSNVGYLVVRSLIEREVEADLKDVLHDQVLAPLGLQSSRLAVTPEDMRFTAFKGGHGYHPGWAFHGFVIGPADEAALALHRLLTGDLLSPASRMALLDAHPLGGEIPGRPWLTTGYGVGIALGTMKTADGTDPFRVIGHSAAGPGSVGAVYHAPGRRRTVAVFCSGVDEGVAENEALRWLLTE
ncbi:MAG TPA: serine hydrolase domain-containing protein [Noviherbaspirillum sp.]|jgi:CubicO group peptidase (beta-lactamase class C family)|uniref:serine hydrolase domain-containing protein n=1 Tax=Noviherbaspirillum sp. TaxID=1926288 RepID=UPI002F936311